MPSPLHIAGVASIGSRHKIAGVPLSRPRSTGAPDPSSDLSLPTGSTCTGTLERPGVSTGSACALDWVGVGVQTGKQNRLCTAGGVCGDARLGVPLEGMTGDSGAVHGEAINPHIASGKGQSSEESTPPSMGPVDVGNCKFARIESSISSSLSVLAPCQVSSWIRCICSRLAMPIANNASKRAPVSTRGRSPSLQRRLAMLLSTNKPNNPRTTKISKPAIHARMIV